MSESSRFKPVTEEQKERAREALEQLDRDWAASEERPKRPGSSRGRFYGAIGLDADGNLQPPLTAEEVARKAVRQQGGCGCDGATGD